MADSAATTIGAKGIPLSDEAPNLSKHNNYMANILKANPGMYETMAAQKTPNGYTFDMAIQTGVDNPGHPYTITVGSTAGDEESYEVWKPFFDQVIASRHNGYPAAFEQPTDMDPETLNFEGFDTNYVLSCRIRTGRSIRGICLPPFCTRAERRAVEKIVISATQTLGEEIPELKGAYESVAEMSEERHDELMKEHLMFDKPVSPILVSGGMARDWPDARGLYLSESKDLIIWVNQEDHMRIISMQSDGDMKAVFTRFCNATNQIQKNLETIGKEYMHNQHLGYIVSCPSNLGTGIRAGCHVKLPLLSENPQFKHILSNLRLEKRGVGGMDTDAEGGVFDISNLDRLGFSEVALVQMVCDGINKLIELEKKLEAQEPIDDMIPEPINVPWKNE